MNLKGILLGVVLLTTIACSNSDDSKKADNSKTPPVTEKNMTETLDEKTYPDVDGSIYGAWMEDEQQTGTGGAVSRSTFQINREKLLLTTVCSARSLTITLKFTAYITEMMDNSFSIDRTDTIKDSKTSGDFTLDCQTGIPVKKLTYSIQDGKLMLTSASNPNDKTPAMKRARKTTGTSVIPAKPEKPSTPSDSTTLASLTNGFELTVGVETVINSMLSSGIDVILQSGKTVDKYSLDPYKNLCFMENRNLTVKVGDVIHFNDLKVESERLAGLATDKTEIGCLKRFASDLKTISDLQDIFGSVAKISAKK